MEICDRAMTKNYECITKVFDHINYRCALTSKALMSVSSEVILATAGWTEESTFRKFYNKPVAVTNKISLAVLT
ncbi:unnamed protein product [Porites evermanni]|uniref:Uncharacterized protein n=1 Tax=Porites evermanni TaxID=104178 RepID=A0ABN8LNC1_9CNID|nr:unnamed protein product [Porites evermanni]